MKLMLRILAIGSIIGMSLLTSVGEEPSVATKIKTIPLFTTPIEWVGEQEPPEADSQSLLKAIEIFKTEGLKAGYEALEKYLAANPKSEWAPSIHLHLADGYAKSGRLSAALDHWNAVAPATGQRSDSRTKNLKAKAQKQLQLFQGTGNGVSCGTLALSEVMRKMLPPGPAAHEVTHVNAPAEGFRLSDLAAISSTNGLPAVAVRRIKTAGLVAPAIIHYRLGHYLALLELREKQVRVFDPLLGGNVWVDREVLDSEMSGNVLLFETVVPDGWKALSRDEADQIRGKVCDVPSTDVDDDEDSGEDDDPADCPPPPPPAANDGPGGGDDDPCEDNGAPPGAGMATWRVAEPNITLWLHDTPLFYRPSSGGWVQLKLSYKHRATSRGNNISGFGDKWECNWISFLEGAADTNTPLVNFRAGGGRTPMAANGTPDYRDLRRLKWAAGVGGYVPAVQNPYGRSVVYAQPVSYLSGVVRHLRTAEQDTYGRTTRQYNYETNGTLAKLTQMTDVDGKICSVAHTNTTFPNLITSVTDPYGRTARFYYNGSGQLTNITDMAGLTSSFQYDGDGNVTNLLTAYGSTGFNYLEMAPTNGNWGRAIEISEPSGSKQVYAYRNLCTYDMVGSGLAYSSYPYQRNSFHWNANQYEALTAGGKTNLLDMPEADYLKASIKNWYVNNRFSANGSYVSGTLNAKAGPAVNGASRVGGVSYVYQGQNENTFSMSFYGVDTATTLNRATQIYWADGNTMEIPRNAQGRPEQFVYHRNGNPVTYTNFYDATGTILQEVRGPRGELMRGYGYDNSLTNLLVSVTNAANEVLRFTHDAGLRLISTIQAGGLVTSNLYSTSGSDSNFLRASMDLGIRTNHYTYTNGNLWRQTNALGLVTTRTWDNLNRLTAVSYPDGSTVSNVYDKLDLVATRNRMNQWTYYAYNAVRQLVGITNAARRVTAIDYCNCGSPGEIIVWNGGTPVITQYAYDLAGRRTNATFPDGYTLSYTYANDRLDSVTDSAGYRVRYDYLTGLDSPSALYLSQSGSSEGTLWTRTFDEYARVESITYRNGVVVTNGYDFLSRLTNRTTLGTGGIYGSITNVESFTYDARGLGRSVDELGKATWYARDAAGRLLSQTNANNEVLGFTYNAADQLLTLTDGKTQTTRWNYDLYGLVTNKVDASNTVVFRYAYDWNSRLTNRWTPAKGDTFYRYDPMGNLTNVDYPGTGMDVALRYDGLDRLTNVVDAVGSTRFGYTAAGQLASEDGPWASDEVTYGYTARRRSSLALAAPNGSPWTTGYGYDEMARLASVQSPVGDFTYQYPGSTANDRADYLYLPGGGYVYNQYDEAARLTGTWLYSPMGGYVNTHAYEYNAASQRTRHTASDGTSPYYENNFTDYTYDNIGQLKTARGTDYAYDSSVYDYVETPRLQEQFGYAYDAAWNLQTRTNNALVQTFNTDSLNQLTTVARAGTLTVAGTSGEKRGDATYGYPHGVTNVTVSGTGLSSGLAEIYADGSWARTNASPATSGASTYTAIALDTYGRTDTNSVNVTLPGSLSFQYDLNGNLTNDGSRAFEYDAENQLTNVFVASSWRTSFAFDAFGRMRIHREYNWQSSAWVQANETRYVYDGMLVVQERDGQNVPQVSYTRGNDLSGTLQGAGGIGGLLARTDMGKHAIGDGTAHALYHADGNGNITCLMQTNGLVVARYSYEPFGRILTMSGPLAEANSYRFSSKEWQERSGLYYYGFRFYEPGLQRWVNRDPIGEEGGVNLFGFVGNRPLDGIDFTGLAIVFVKPGTQGPPAPGDTWVPCPEAPQGFSLQKNMAKAESIASQPTQQYPMTGFGPTAGKYIWFHDQVKTDGPWDYKNQPTHGAHPEYEDLGNFNYGATGSATGIDPWTLQNMAGIVQQNDPKTRHLGEGAPGNPLKPGSGIPPYGDQKTDNDWIKNGIEYQKQYPPSKGLGPCG